MQSIIKGIGSILGTVCVYLFGGLDIALQTLLVFIAIDYLTGLMKAYKNKKMNSKVGLLGILKKIGFLCLVTVGCMLDRVAGDTGFIRTSIIYYLVANEGLSIIENLGEMNILVPEFLKEKLEQLKNKEV